MENERIIRSRRGLIPVDFAELWRYRELFGFMAWRRIIVRYRQAVIGIGWAAIRPIFSMVVFTFVFSNLAGMSSGGVPYPLLTFAAILPWHFFAGSLLNSGGSVVENSGMISKVYFPRLILPFSTVLAGAADFLVSLVIYVLLLGWYRRLPPVQVLALPGFFLLAAFAALGIGLWLAALNVKYRDVRHIVPFLVQTGFFVSPVGYRTQEIHSRFPEWFCSVYSLNPMVGVIDGFRWCLLGQAPPDWWGIVASAAIIAAVFISGLYYFRATERRFADII
ncbi:MAG: ABC transporter permease [Kiritimatiellae bacterium]|nr:ABC transporter permease [Kiritimatiellia bacterium]